MSRKGLIPWGRGQDVPMPRFDEPSSFLALHHQMNRLVDDFFRDFDLPATGRSGWQGSWPNVEINETDKEYKLVAELPGIDDKDVEVTLHEGVLTLKGEKKSEASSEGRGGRYSERWFGKFERSFNLGSDIDPDKVSAAFKKGVLTVTVSKRPSAQSSARRIPVDRES
jgi:HSP20 family protein